MAQSVKCMFYNHKDLSLNPRIHVFFFKTTITTIIPNPPLHQKPEQWYTLAQGWTVSSLA